MKKFKMLSVVMALTLMFTMINGFAAVAAENPDSPYVETINDIQPAYIDETIRPCTDPTAEDGCGPLCTWQYVFGGTEEKWEMDCQGNLTRIIVEIYYWVCV